MNIKEYISQNGGYISSAEAKEKSLYNQLLYEVEKGTIVRSAWSHYGLTTQIPISYCIAIERSRKVTLPEYPPFELFFLSKSVFELGISETVIEDFHVKIYDMEKSVCDAVKYRNRIGIDVSSEILRNYLSRKDRDITRLYAYANAMRLGKRMDELVKYMI